MADSEQNVLSPSTSPNRIRIFLMLEATELGPLKANYQIISSSFKGQCQQDNHLCNSNSLPSISFTDAFTDQMCACMCKDA